MNIKSIEPTPSPNTMKINLDQELPGGARNNYTKENAAEAPTIINKMFEVEGVKGVYHVADFLALERNARVDWAVILPQVRAIFGEDVSEANKQITSNHESFGEVQVFVHFFKRIPIQVKVTDGETEKRFGLPSSFQKALKEAELPGDNIVMMRKWVEQGVRYGELDDIGAQVVEELEAAYTDERLNDLVERAQSPEKIVEREKIVVTSDMLDNPDWRARFAALEKMDPEEKDIPVLMKALKDEKAAIRRLAVVYLGMVESKEVLPLLCEAVLHDSSVTVRRTAGDCLSDLGDPAAIPTMIRALKDKNKLVRWRAAMFLYEVGDETALDALREAQYDSEFEVAMQIKLALKRIEAGEEAVGSVWKQMTERNN
ncbi:virulence factor [Bacillus sp. HMF5848]|uniref:conserved virulence factor C family protein n=1 Tax=Bacillus sp. HMF5848 TaxID=2495421 RepID=UPI000F7693F5|nr:virulence factor [Bacillus sp. HMF5848]RSK25976.1 virulence factor [Bacillus sp. HMF5848]